MKPTEDYNSSNCLSEPELDENGNLTLEGAKRREYMKAGETLQALIEKGAWIYPLDKFQNEFSAYKSPDHTIAMICGYLVTLLGAFVLLGEIIGMIVAFAAFVPAFIHIDRRKKLIAIFIQNADRHLAGKMAQVTPVPAPQASANASDEIAKLHALFKAGAITEVEFQDAKARVLGKAS